MELLFPLIIFVLIWVLLILPQQRRVRAHQAVVATLSVGQHVMTTSGIYGTVTALDDEDARVEVAPGVELRIARGAIAKVVDPDEPGEPDAAADAAPAVDVAGVADVADTAPPVLDLGVEAPSTDEPRGPVVQSRFRRRRSSGTDA